MNIDEELEILESAKAGLNFYETNQVVGKLREHVTSNFLFGGGGEASWGTAIAADDFNIALNFLNVKDYTLALENINRETERNINQNPHVQDAEQKAHAEEDKIDKETNSYKRMELQVKTIFKMWQLHSEGGQLTPPTLQAAHSELMEGLNHLLERLAFLTHSCINNPLYLTTGNELDITKQEMFTQEEENDPHHPAQNWGELSNEDWTEADTPPLVE